eukprot:3027039-Prymnesium_polylepis.2
MPAREIIVWEQETSFLYARAMCKAPKRPSRNIAHRQHAVDAMPEWLLILTRTRRATVGGFGWSAWSDPVVGREGCSDVYFAGRWSRRLLVALGIAIGALWGRCMGRYVSCAKTEVQVAVKPGVWACVCGVRLLPSGPVDA